MSDANDLTEIDRLHERDRQAAPAQDREVLECRFDFEEVRVLGDYAYEWGTVRGKTRDLATGSVADSVFELLRILHKEDGEWKVHRAMWNSPGPG